MNRLTDKDWHKTKFMGLNEREVLHGLWELENKLEQGEAFEPPCKVGDTVFYVSEVDYDGRTQFAVLSGVVTCFNIDERCREAFVRYKGGLTYWHNFTDFGKEVFTVAEDAKARFKELQEQRK